jgi:hypothetical protein
MRPETGSGAIDQHQEWCGKRAVACLGTSARERFRTGEFVRVVGIGVDRQPDVHPAVVGRFERRKEIRELRG